MRVLAAAALVLAGPAVAPALAQEAPVTIVMNLDLEDDTSIRRALTSIRPILDHIRQHPGLISESLLMGSISASPDYVHVMQWESQEAWESLYEDEAFLETLSRMNPGFQPSFAQIFSTVSPQAQP